MGELGKVLVFTGALLLLTGFVVLLVAKIPGSGRLPGDIIIKRANFTFYFPLMTSLLLSAVLSFALFFINRR